MSIFCIHALDIETVLLAKTHYQKDKCPQLSQLVLEPSHMEVRQGEVPKLAAPLPVRPWWNYALAFCAS